jgi:hypothetical protein
VRTHTQASASATFIITPPHFLHLKEFYSLKDFAFCHVIRLFLARFTAFSAMFSMNLFIIALHKIIVASFFYYWKTMFEGSFSMLPAYIYMLGFSINRSIP